MHELDKFVTSLSKEYDKGVHPKPNKAYNKLQRELKKVPRDDHERYDMLRKKLRQTPSKDQMDPGYIRVKYVRYADDFIVGIAGPVSLANIIKLRIETFLRENLQLEMNKSKTKLTHFTHHYIKFLGWLILNNRLHPKKMIRNKLGVRQRVVNRLIFHAPIKDLLDKRVLSGVMKWNRDGTFCGGTRLGRLVNWDHARIIRYFQQKIDGILNYYSFADNMGKLGWIVHRLKHSCALTLTLKFKLQNRGKAFKKFGSSLKDPDTGRRLSIPLTFKRKPRIQD